MTIFLKRRKSPLINLKLHLEQRQSYVKNILLNLILEVLWNKFWEDNWQQMIPVDAREATLLSHPSLRMSFRLLKIALRESITDWAPAASKNKLQNLFQKQWKDSFAWVASALKRSRRKKRWRHEQSSKRNKRRIST